MPVLVNPSRFGAPVAASYSATVLADSPLCYYRLGEASGTTMTDSSGNGRNGAYDAGVTLGATGAIGDGDTALTLPGTGPVGRVTSDVSWMNVSSHTCEVWVKTTASVLQVALSRANGTNSPWFIGVAATGQGFYQTRVGGNVNITGTATVNDGNWHHLVGTYDGANMVLYVDGVQDGTTARTGTLATGSFTIQVGGRGSNFLAGSIDESALYGTALSSARIAAHYAAR